jgi:hypothetical protein
LDEIEYFLNRLENIPEPTNNENESSFIDTFKSLQQNCKIAIDAKQYPTLMDLISPIIEVAQKNFPFQYKEKSSEVEKEKEQEGTDNESQKDNSMIFPCFVTSWEKKLNDNQSPPVALSLRDNIFLRHFESVLGEVLAILFERRTRG